MKVAVLPKLLRLSSQFLALAVLVLMTVPLADQDVTAPLADQDVSPPVEDIGALLLIVGCSDDLSQCRELPAPVSIFETKEDCDQQLPDSLRAFTGQFEQLYAQCLSVDPAMEDEDAELVWEVHPDGTLVASVEAAPPQRVEPTETVVALVRP
jgi:hypothetical protein